MWPLRSEKWVIVAEKLRMHAGKFIAEPRAITRSECIEVHDAQYVDRFLAGQLTELEMRRIGVPNSEAFRQRTLRVTGAAAVAAEELLGGRSEAVAVIGGGARESTFVFAKPSFLHVFKIMPDLLMAQDIARSTILQLQVSL